jgi:hypothetical protein
MGLQLCGNVPVGCIILAYDKGACCILIDPVDDTRPDLAVDPGKAVPAVIHDRVHKRTFRMSRGRVDSHAFGLINNQNIVVLIKNIERDILRQDFSAGRLRNMYFHALSAGQFTAALESFSVNCDIAVGYKLLDTGSREIGKLL